MILTLYPHTTIGELQQQFSGFFPNLRLEIGCMLFTWKNGSRSLIMCTAETRVENFIRYNGPGNYTIEIFPWETVREVKDKFGRYYGLNVQVMQPYKKIWVGVSSNDEKSLEDLNYYASGSEKDRTDQGSFQVG